MIVLNPSLIEQFEKVVGTHNLLTQEIDRILYSYDAAIERAMPCGIIFPETTDQISKILQICNAHEIPFVVRGAATNLCGATIPLRNALVIAPTKMKKMISIDLEKKIAIVEPGVPNLFLKKVLQPYGLHYAPDPSSQKACTIGGNIGTNAGGPHCLKYGVTSQHILALEIVLTNGEIINLDLRHPGYDLTGLMVGSEGTLGIVTQATLQLTPIPQFVETMLVSFPSLDSAIKTVTEIIADGIIPACLEAMDKITVNAIESFIHAGYPTDAEAVLIIELDGNLDLKEQVKSIQTICKNNQALEFRLAHNELERNKLWEGRRGAYPSLARISPNVLVEDGAVPRNRLPEAAQKIRKIAEEYGVTVCIIFHAGDGNLHPQLLFDERDIKQTQKVKAAGYAMLKACIDLGGTISGEHGVGTDKREAMKWLFNPETLNFFRKIKNTFDPKLLANPDKLIPLADSLNIEKSITENTAFPNFDDLNTEQIEPLNKTDIQKTFKQITQFKKNIYIQGAQTHNKPILSTYKHILSTIKLNEIIQQDTDNFTIQVQAGIKIEELQKILAVKNQKVLLAGSGTLGGLLASNPLQFPRIRDQILGMGIILANGDWIQLGANVMKNVAGYDAAKLYLGSWGSLGLIFSVILKTYPLTYPFNAEQQTEQKIILPQPVIEIHKKLKAQLDPSQIFMEPSFLN